MAVAFPGGELGALCTVRKADGCPALKRPIPGQLPLACVYEVEEGTYTNHYWSKTQGKVPGCCIQQRRASTLTAAVGQTRREGGIPRVPVAAVSDLRLLLYSRSSGGSARGSDSCHHRGIVRKSWKSLWGICTPMAGPALPGDAGVTLPTACSGASRGTRCLGLTCASFGAMGRHPRA